MLSLTQWPRNCSRLQSHSLASRGGANHGWSPPLLGSAPLVSSGAILLTHAAPGPLSALRAQAPTYPPTTGPTLPPVRTSPAPTIKSGAQTAMTYTRRQAPRAPSSKHALPLASCKSCRKRELNDSAEIYDGSQHPDQLATIQSTGLRS